MRKSGRPSPVVRRYYKAWEVGGRYKTRTRDSLGVNEVLYQLS